MNKNCSSLINTMMLSNTASWEVNSNIMTQGWYRHQCSQMKTRLKWVVIKRQKKLKSAIYIVNNFKSRNMTIFSNTLNTQKRSLNVLGKDAILRSVIEVIRRNKYFSQCINIFIEFFNVFILTFLKQIPPPDIFNDFLRRFFNHRNWNEFFKNYI